MTSKAQIAGATCFLAFMVFTASPLWAGGLDAQLDGTYESIPRNTSTVISASLQNSGSSALFITGVQVAVSENAAGDVYNPSMLYQELHQLSAEQTWDGPLAVITPKHRGPLEITGSIIVKGGSSPSSTDTLASIPLELTVDDPRRNPDGSYERGTKPVCDRSADRCCDASEISCVLVAGRCIYLAEGFDSEELCMDKQPGKVYEHITNLQVSSDTAHVAYIANFECSLSGDGSEFCKRAIVLDKVEQKGPESPTHLILSPDGRHTAYIARESCMTRLGFESCAGGAQVVLDGQAGPEREAAQSLSFSPDSRHLAYEMGKDCHITTTRIPSELVCKTSSPMVDEQPVQKFPDWYAPSQVHADFLKKEE